MKRHVGLSLLLSTTLPLALPAQDFKWQQVDELGIKYRVYKKLKEIPLTLGTSHPNLRARYEPVAAGDFIWGSKGAFPWELKVYEFKSASGPTTSNRKPKSRKEAEAMARDMNMSKRKASSFREFITASGKDPTNREREFNPKAKGIAKKKNQGVGGKLPYTWWEYSDWADMQNRGSGERFRQLWYSCAAVYDLGDREVALVTHMPCKKDKLSSKHKGWARKMLLSTSLLKDKEIADGSTEDKLLRYAKTPERQKAVEAAVANIAGLDNWDVFTTESYIVLYSWPAGKNDKKKKNFLRSKDLAENMDRMRELYKEYYPPEEGTVFPYSVMRICSTVNEFQTYGKSGPGVVGWFSPRSKELVLFLSNDKEMTKTVAFHEGWHQYSDTYFPDVELQRWFDEGTGDYFGSFFWKGGKWKYDVSKMRKVSIKTIVSSKKFVPLNEIVTWNKDKFYGPQAANFYAQGYAMVDFLQRGGKKRTSGWDKSWANILETYRATMLEKKNPKKAVEAAFAGVDWDKFTKAWVKWVKSY